jgi:hypothetical protein
METYTNLHGTKTKCECDLSILVDERVFSLGYRCVKCGLNADERLDEYVKRLNIEPHA